MKVDQRILYFDIDHAVSVHDWIIEKSGGKTGIHDLGSLEGALCHVKNDEYYPTFEHKLAHLIFSINKFHAFQDGNKRSSIALGAYFLELNGYKYCVQYFTQEMENIAVWIADNKINKELTHRIICSLISEDEFPEDLKLSIAQALQ